MQCRLSNSSLFVTKIMFVFRGDEELDTLIKATIAGGGVIPHIHKSLIGKKGEGTVPVKSQ